MSEEPAEKENRSAVKSVMRILFPAVIVLVLVIVAAGLNRFF